MNEQSRLRMLLGRFLNLRRSHSTANPGGRSKSCTVIGSLKGILTGLAIGFFSAK
jgi:hypothetical protein